MTDPAPTPEPDAIAHMTDVELETFARTVVAERDALAAGLESTRADNERLRERERELAASIRDGAPTEQAKWEAAVAWTLRHAQHAVECGDCRDTMDTIIAERDAARAELAAERAKVQGVEAAIASVAERSREQGAWIGTAWVDEVHAAVRAALAAAQPTGKTP